MASKETAWEPSKAVAFVKMVEGWMASNPEASPDDLAVALLPHLYRGNPEQAMDDAVTVAAAALATTADLIVRARGGGVE